MTKRIVSKGTVMAYIDFNSNLDKLDDMLLAQIKEIVEDCYHVEKIEVIDTRVRKYKEGFEIDLKLYYENEGTLTKFAGGLMCAPEVDIVFDDDCDGEFDFSLFQDKIEELNKGLTVMNENTLVMNIDMYDFLVEAQ